MCSFTKSARALVSRPEVLWKKDPAGMLLEPIEKLFLEIPQEHMGPIMEYLAFRKRQRGKTTVDVPIKRGVARSRCRLMVGLASPWLQEW